MVWLGLRGAHKNAAGLACYASSNSLLPSEARNTFPQRDEKISSTAILKNPNILPRHNVMRRNAM